MNHNTTIKYSDKWECKGKRIFDNKNDVQKEINRIINESYGGCVNLNSYKCKYCGFYHLTSRN